MTMIRQDILRRMITRATRFCALYLLGCAIFSYVWTSPTHASAAGKGRKAPSIEACKHVVAYANRGQLRRLVLPSADMDSPHIQKPDNLSIVFQKRMDINNDGILERVFVESQGTMHIEAFHVYPLQGEQAIDIKRSPDDDWESNNLRWAFDQAFIQFRGVTYILSKTDQSLHYLAYLNPQNVLTIVCEFGQKARPVQRLKTSHNDKVCRLAATDKIRYVEFTEPHPLTFEMVRDAGFWEITPGEKAASVDLDNDGKKESVIALPFASGRGRGCDGTFLGVLTADKGAIDKDFTGKLPGARCRGTTVTPFLVDGNTYLDERQPGPYAEHRQIYTFAKKQLTTLCTFDVWPDQYILTPMQRIIRAAWNENPWAYAIRQSGTSAVEILLRSGRDVNEAAGLPLQVAIGNDRADMLELLLQAGANPHAKNDHEFPLERAVRYGKTKIVSLLLQYGMRVRARTTLGRAGPRALQVAIQDQRDDMLELLLKAGVSPNAKSHQVSPLYEAVRFGTDQAVALLLHYGAKANTSTGNTYGAVVLDDSWILSRDHDAVAEAIARGSLEKLQILLHAGSVITDATAIEAVAGRSRDRHEKLPLLLAHGLDVHRHYTLDVVGTPEVRPVESAIKAWQVSKTLLQWATAAGDSQAVHILEEAIAKTSEALQRLRAADADLNAAYQQWFASLQANNRRKLRDAQRAWLRQRDTQCNVRFSGTSMEKWLHYTAAQEGRALCVLATTRERTAQLVRRELALGTPPA